MSKINILDHQTIDQIAAGEVVERPSSVVKELVENSMDAGADIITVEIKKGGIEFIRVTDNGFGIAKDDMEKAFLRHATSKITSMEDLKLVRSMGFRGEALASIASVSRVEVISKCPEDFMGSHYEIEGGEQVCFEEVGAPDGTTIIVRNLFYNTPVRRKFLKAEGTEKSYIIELMQELAMSRPDISFQLITDNNTKFSTTGSNDLREIIYRLYGRDFVNEIVPFSYETGGVRMEGYLGTPTLNRANRNLENYYVNRRFIKSDIIAKGIERGYRAYMMQHKFPFCVIHFTMDTAEIDVNVHPTKKEVRFHDGKAIYDMIVEAVSGCLRGNEMIAAFSIDEEKNVIPGGQEIPQPFEKKRLQESGIAPQRERTDEAKSSFEKSDALRSGRDARRTEGGQDSGAFLPDRNVSKIQIAENDLGNAEKELRTNGDVFFEDIRHDDARKDLNKAEDAVFFEDLRDSDKENILEKRQGFSKPPGNQGLVEQRYSNKLEHPSEVSGDKVLDGNQETTDRIGSAVQEESKEPASSGHAEKRDTALGVEEQRVMQEESKEPASFGHAEKRDTALGAEEQRAVLVNRIHDSLQNPKKLNLHDNVIKGKEHIIVEKPRQLALFDEERVLSEKSRSMYEIIGQVFDTYWLIAYKDAIYFVDQHAAHEKVNYERLMKQVAAGEVARQLCNPPVIVSLTAGERLTLEENLSYFEKLGFVMEEFGGSEYALREIPLELYSREPKDMFLDVLNELSETSLSGTPEVVAGKIASMACKASVKGGQKISRKEMETLLDEMLTLENPYHCPHGRPTMFSMSRYELEKKFKRIVD